MNNKENFINCKKYKNVKTYFYNNVFFTNKFVYKTKYETEYIIYLLDFLIKQKKINTLFDICSGNGCIGITIKKKYKYLKVFLLEKNIYATECIVKNIILQNVNLNVYYTDVFKFFKIVCDVVVCNPPYIDYTVLQNKKIYKTIYDSLNGGKNGLTFVLKLFAILENVNYVILEIGSEQQFLSLKEKIKKKWQCIKFLKPYINLKICFCIFKNLKYPLLDSNQHG